MAMHQQWDESEDDDDDMQMRIAKVRWQTLRLQYTSGAFTDWPRCPRCRGVLEALQLDGWRCVAPSCNWRGWRTNGRAGR